MAIEKSNGWTNVGLGSVFSAFVFVSCAERNRRSLEWFKEKTHSLTHARCDPSDNSWPTPFAEEEKRGEARQVKAAIAVDFFLKIDSLDNNGRGGGG